jgi:hypothetical protein
MPRSVIDSIEGRLSGMSPAAEKMASMASAAMTIAARS